ncbi:hypothetical protein AAHH79_43040, partial [Burkholderia pseudomallei]
LALTDALPIDVFPFLSSQAALEVKRRLSLAAKSVRPLVKLLDANGDEVKIPGTEHAVQIGVQVGALNTVKDGQQVQV